MNVTRMTVAGYDDDNSMFAVSFVAGRASVILTLTDEGGETVRSMWQETADTFEAVRDLVERVVNAPAPASSRPR